MRGIETNRQSLEKAMQTKWAGKDIFYFETIDSTNAEAIRLAGKDGKHGTLVVANTQEMGRGRRGRSWFSPSETTISMSLLLFPDLEKEKASMLTLVQALAVSKAINEVAGLDSSIKWPNDILIHEKKVCGILTEMELGAGASYGIIIGTGINVNQESFPTEIENMATSIKKEGGKEISRVELIAKICTWFETYYAMFMETKDLSLLLEEYNQKLVSANKTVRVMDPSKEFSGKALGINSQGELLVEKEDGKVVNVYAGEVSVRGIYGYV